MAAAVIDLADRIRERRLRHGVGHPSPNRAEEDIDRLLSERQGMLDRLAQLGREKDLAVRELELWKGYGQRLEEILRSTRAALRARCPGCGREPEPHEQGDPRHPHYAGCRRCWKKREGRPR